jgi:hypothetical protein
VLTSSPQLPADAVEVPEAVDLLEYTAERLHQAAAREGLSAATAARLRRLADDLSSHALAARVLATTGASPQALERVLRRAIDLVDADAPGEAHPDRSAS